MSSDESGNGTGRKLLWGVLVTLITVLMGVVVLAAQSWIDEKNASDRMMDSRVSSLETAFRTLEERSQNEREWRAEIKRQLDRIEGGLRREDRK